LGIFQSHTLIHTDISFNSTVEQEDNQ